MCNLYSVRSTQEELRRLFQVRPEWDMLGNWPGKNAVFPDGEAPVVRGGGDGGRELLLMRWGLPGPKIYGERPTTNIRNPMSPHWRAWLKPDYRCLVPATSFCEPHSQTKRWHWFARGGELRQPFAFAGVWRPWTGARGTKSNPIEGDHLLYSFLTTEPNGVVGPIHQKAMPVILTEDDWQEWLTAPAERVTAIQERPIALELISLIPGNHEKRDPPAAAEAPPAMQGALL
jgi:putative SOS response-associated peptidase YedK